MPFDPKTIMAEFSVPSCIEGAIQAAYDRGLKDGVQRLIAAAEALNQSATPAPSQAMPATPPPTIWDHRPRALVLEADTGDSPEGVKRVRRGLVQETLAKVLAEKPGLSISDYERLVAEIEPDISSKSVGNDLRRYEGSKYRRDRPGGNRWFLFDFGNEGAGDSLPSEPAPSYVPLQLEGR